MRPMDWVTGVLVGLVCAVLNYGASFVWVFIYSTAINPGHDEAFYQAYAQQAAPMSSVIVGPVIFFIAGFVFARGRTLGRALGVAAVIAGTYIALDSTLLTLLGAWPAIIPIAALSFSTKMAACLAGAWLAARGRRATN
jgi:hypothetical protein